MTSGAARLARAFLLLGAWMCVAAPPKIDWSKVNPETLEHFSTLIRIDTSNPPGNETRAAEYLKKVLEENGIPSKLYALDPARANLVARIKGTGKKRPILVMGHTDVVGVQRDKWAVDPFGAVRKDGFIYGRGAVDDKDNLVAGLMLMLLLKRHNVELDRDIIFLAEAGEESTTTVGIDYMVENHWPEIDAEFALAEGGYISSRKGKVQFVEITTTEKIPRAVRLVAKGTAGHGSRPRLDNAIVRLASAVAKVGAWTPPARLNDTTRTYFERLSLVSEPDEARRYKDIFIPGKREEAERYFAANELGHHSMLRTSISPTILKGGFRHNVIPSEAEATLDIRILPDEDFPGFLEHLRKLINDPNVQLIGPSTTGRPPSPPSRLDSEMFRAFEAVQKRLYPAAVTLPGMLTGATDMAQLRAKGVQAYGFGPIIETREGGLYGAHSDDERISEEGLYKLVEFLWEAVIEVAAPR